MSNAQHGPYPLPAPQDVRWSPRTFGERPVSAATLRHFFEAARWSPSCFNEQPWRFLTTRHGEPGHERLAECLTEKNREWAAKAPVLILAVAHGRFSRNDKPNRWAGYDTGQAVAHLTVAATTLGLHLHQMGGFDVDAARRHCAIPDDAEPMAVIALGYPDPEATPSPRKRRSQDDLVFGAHWGRPLTTDYDLHRVLETWFGHLDAHGMADEAHGRRWWMKDPDFDTWLTDTFGDDLDALSDGGRDRWLETPRGRLAWIIVADQFSRNIHRGTGAMYDLDASTVKVVLAGLERGDDQQLACAERIFFYMPLMHAEDLDHQDRCVALFTALRDEAPEAITGQLTMNVDFAIKHRDIVARFGRFPHRNALLGRESTPEEAQFLTEPGSSF